MNKKIKNATLCEYNGIVFRSKQEMSIYKYLLSRNIVPEYEPQRFKIWDRDKFSVPYYDKYGKEFKRITRKPTSVHYTPDFIFKYKGMTVILEVKGFKNDVTPYKIRMFREYLDTHCDSKNTCYAVVYTIKNLKSLLNDIDRWKEEV